MAKHRDRPGHESGPIVGEPVSPCGSETGAGIASGVRSASSPAAGAYGLSADERTRLHETVIESLNQHVPVGYEDKKLLQDGDYDALLAKLTDLRNALRGSPWEGPVVLLAGIVGGFGFNKLLALRGLDSSDTLRWTITTAFIWAVSVPFSSRVRNARALAALDRARDALLVLSGQSAAADAVQADERAARGDGRRC